RRCADDPLRLVRLDIADNPIKLTHKRSQDVLENGVPIDQVLAELAERHRMDDPYADRPGMVNMYNTGLDTVEKVATDAFGMYIHVNPLYSSTFPSVYALEKELVR